jgi:hypothetical protein
VGIPEVAGADVRAATLALAALAAATPAAAEQSHLLVVAGLGGDPRSRDLFHEQAVTLASTAETQLGLAPENVTCLTEKPEREPSTIDGRSTLENLTAAFDGLSGRVRPGDRVFVVLIGHGSFRSGEGRFNLPGPDLTPARLAQLLDRLDEQDLVVVSTASASGAFAEPLAAPGRVVVTATKSGQERNQTVFGEHFVAALTGDGADVDKDGRVSILEAFEYARREVERFYGSQNRLQTEHARLEDGSGLARQAFLQGAGRGRPGEAEVAEGDPALAALYAERRELEGEIEALRARKDDLPEESYEEQLETLLLELALKNESIDTAGGGEP